MAQKQNVFLCFVDFHVVLMRFCAAANE
jgi:hypothetical protein